MAKKLSRIERRIDLMFYLSEVRVTHYSELMKRYNVSKPTLISDVRYLFYELCLPITITKGKYGGIKLENNWSVYNRHLKRYQQEAIYEAMDSVSDDCKDALHSIVHDFGNPFASTSDTKSEEGENEKDNKGCLEKQNIEECLREEKKDV